MPGCHASRFYARLIHGALCYVAGAAIRFAGRTPCVPSGLGLRACGHISTVYTTVYTKPSMSKLQTVQHQIAVPPFYMTAYDDMEESKNPEA